MRSLGRFSPATENGQTLFVRYGGPAFPLLHLSGEGTEKWRLSIVTKIMEWGSITALLLVVSWRPFASYQLPLDSVVCAGTVLTVLVLLFITRQIEPHYGVDEESNHAREVTVRL